MIEEKLDTPFKFTQEGRAYPLKLVGDDTEIDIFFNDVLVGSIGGSGTDFISQVNIPNLRAQLTPAPPTSIVTFIPSGGACYGILAGPTGINFVAFSGFLEIKDSTGTVRCVPVF